MLLRSRRMAEPAKAHAEAVPDDTPSDKWTHLCEFVALEGRKAYAQAVDDEEEKMEVDIDDDGDDKRSAVTSVTQVRKARGWKLHLSSNATGYKGVTASCGVFYAHISRHASRINLGQFKTATDAAVAYARAAHTPLHTPEDDVKAAAAFGTTWRRPRTTLPALGTRQRKAPKRLSGAELRAPGQFTKRNACKAKEEEEEEEEEEEVVAEAEEPEDGEHELEGGEEENDDEAAGGGGGGWTDSEAGMAKLVSCVEGAGGSAALVSGWKCASKSYARTARRPFSRVEMKYIPPAGPVLRYLAAVKRHLALVGNDTMPQPSSTASSQPAAPAPRDPRSSTVGPATPSNASRPKAGLLHVVGYLKKTLQLDASLSVSCLCAHATACPFVRS